MTRKNFKYPWHKLINRGDFFVTNSPIDKISKAAAMHFALRRPDEIVRCISCTHDVFVVLVEAAPRNTQKLYDDVVDTSGIEVVSGAQVEDKVIDDDEEDNSFEEVLE